MSICNSNGFCIPTGQEFCIIDVLLIFGFQQLTIQLFQAALQKKLGRKYVR